MTKDRRRPNAVEQAATRKTRSGGVDSTEVVRLRSYVQKGMLMFRPRRHFAIAVAAIIFAAAGLSSTASATPLDVRVAWDYDGINDPGSYAPNSPAADFNEIKGQFANQNQTSGHNAANLNDAISPYPLTSVAVTWSGWRRFNSNIPAAFSADRDWVDRAGTASQLAGNDGGAATNALVTFSGLTSGNSYKVEMVMTGVGGVPWNVRINSLAANHSFLNTAGQNAAVAAWNPQTNGSNQRDWLVWDAALATGTTLTINFSNAGSAGLDGLHAIRITGAIVPEPSTFVLGLLGAAGLFALARRRATIGQLVDRPIGERS